MTCGDRATLERGPVNGRCPVCSFLSVEQPAAVLVNVDGIHTLKCQFKAGMRMRARACNSTPPEVEAGGLCAQGEPGLHMKSTVYQILC